MCKVYSTQYYDLHTVCTYIQTLMKLDTQLTVYTWLGAGYPKCTEQHYQGTHSTHVRIHSIDYVLQYMHK